MNKTDALLWSTLKCLERDFRKVLCSEKETDLHLDLFRMVVDTQDAASLREFQFPSFLAWSPSKTKRLYQLQSFMKRWILGGDVWTQSEIDSRTVADFIATQRTEVLESLVETPASARILDGAREICATVLGAYDEEEHHRRCRFGAKAAFNLPARFAYLHNRIPRMSATAAQKYRWRKWVEDDPQLRIAMSQTDFDYTLTDALNLTVVPKSWKIGRAIVPDTILGGFVANGLGDMIASRLRVNAGLDLRRKQAEHQRMAQKASVTGHLVTADMSKASDRLSWPLLQRILPPDWLSVIEVDRVHRVEVSLADNSEKHKITCKSPLLMGKGYTFPLQSLIFYTLLKSIAQALNKPHARISVYGDDLIYPAYMHKYVVRMFEACGLQFNQTKTFAGKPSTQLRTERGCFRESCGGDYLCGFSIRPYTPEGASGDATYNTSGGYAALCYTLLNGLLSRWKWHEIMTTVRFLLTEACCAVGFIPIVPQNSSVSEGLRYEWSLVGYITAHEPLWPVRMPYIRRNLISNSYSDDCYCWKIKEQREATVVPEESVYLWNALRLATLRSERLVPPMQSNLQRLAAIPGILEEWVEKAARQKWEETPQAMRLRPKDRDARGKSSARFGDFEPTYAVEPVVESKETTFRRFQVRLERVSTLDWTQRS